MKRAVPCLLSALFLTGCASSPDNMKMLEEQNRNLAADLQTAEKQVADLTATLEKQTKVANALGEEKSARIEETGNLRQKVRAFLKAQISSFREFSQNGEFLDYVGGELIDREKTEGRDVTLVDMKNSIPSGGPLLGTWGYFTSPCSYVVDILRKANDEWFVVWQGGPFEVAGTKLQKFDFRVPVSAEKGDVIAYTFRGPVGVPFGSGTGETLYATGELAVGGKVSVSELLGKSDARAYSIGVVGILE